MFENHLVKLITCGTNRLRDDNAAHGDDGNLRGATTDVDDHGARRVLDGQIRSDGSGHRLLDEEGLASARLNSSFENGTLLNGSNARGNADDNARTRTPGITTR